MNKTPYNQSVKWTDFNGNVTKVEVQGFSSSKEAKTRALESAKEFGWTPPRWWQWWRWNDTQVSDLI